jgi:AcrR family transcriptional regulator
LTREAVLTAARELLTEGGLDGLTMRALARRLAVAPNALYSHVQSKNGLVDDLLDELLASVRTPRGEVEDPIDGLTEVMSSTYTVLTAHPDVVPLYLARQGARGPNAVRLGEVMDALLVRAGVHGPAVAEARRVLIIHTIGSAAFATGAPDADRPIPTSESLHAFGQSLSWLLTGIAETASSGDAASRRRAPRS